MNNDLSKKSLSAKRNSVILAGLLSKKINSLKVDFKCS